MKINRCIELFYSKYNFITINNNVQQAGAELCQAQGKFRRVRLALDLYLI